MDDRLQTLSSLVANLSKRITKMEEYMERIGYSAPRDGRSINWDIIRSTKMNKLNQIVPIPEAPPKETPKAVQKTKMPVADFIKSAVQNLPIQVFTDGACSHNPGPGGYGVYMVQGNILTEISGGSASTTNNRMEMTAPIEALKVIPPRFNVKICTDSKYLKDGITKWIKGWKKNKWITKTKDPVKNQDLWQILDEARSNRNVSWEWVKGHADTPGNVRADRLATSAIPGQANENKDKRIVWVVNEQ